MNKVLKLALCIVPLLMPLTALTAEVSEAELRSDCEEEGSAEGLSGADLKEYIADCIAEFSDADMSSNIKVDE